MNVYIILIVFWWQKQINEDYLSNLVLRNDKITYKTYCLKQYRWYIDRMTGRFRWLFIYIFWNIYLNFNVFYIQNLQLNEVKIHFKKETTHPTLYAIQTYNQASRGGGSGELILCFWYTSELYISLKSFMSQLSSIAFLISKISYFMVLYGLSLTNKYIEILTICVCNKEKKEAICNYHAIHNWCT